MIARVGATLLCLLGPTSLWGVEHINLRLMYHHGIGIDDYDECATAPPKNRSHALYHQFVAISRGLDDCGLPHFLMYGTLLGAVRDHGIRYEVDNDIAIDGRLEECREQLRENNIIITADGRACTRSSERSFFSPFQSYFPYTDFYPVSDFKGYPCNLTRIRIGNHYLPVPPIKVAKAWLRDYYGDSWLLPPKVRKKEGLSINAY